MLSSRSAMDGGQQLLNLGDLKYTPRSIATMTPASRKLRHLRNLGTGLGTSRGLQPQGFLRCRREKSSDPP